MALLRGGLGHMLCLCARSLRGHIVFHHITTAWPSIHQHAGSRLFHSSSIPLSGLSDCLCGCSVLYPMPSLGALTTEIPGSRDITRALVSSDAWGRLLLVQIQDCKIDIHLLSPGCSSILEIVVGVAVVRIRSIGCAWGRSDGWSS